MANAESPDRRVVDLGFMVSDENAWNDENATYKSVFWHRSISDTEILLDTEFAEEEPVPLATFTPDFSAEKWKKSANLEAITKHVSDWAKYLSDPDEPYYLEIPFPESFREDIRNQFRMDAGLDILRSSRSMREYFRYWSKYQEAVVSEASLVRPNLNTNWNYGCSGFLAVFIILFFATGIQTNNMGGATFFIVLFGGGIFWLLRSGKRRVEAGLRDFEKRVQGATAHLAKARKKLFGFLERNGWFATSVDEVLVAADELAEKFIKDQEVILSQRRTENMYIDSSEPHRHAREAEDEGAFRTVPRKMERFSPRDYEVFCAGWVEYLGGKNVRVTQQSADGGIDIVSDNEVAQVKLHGSPVSVQPIRELFGVAQSVSKTPLFFTSTGYTQAAITFAEANDVFLFIADPVKEDLKGVTEISRALKRTGLTLNRAVDDVPIVFGNDEDNAHSGIDGYEDGRASDGYLNR